MFSNLQNKIDLKRIRTEVIEINKDFPFEEDFDIVNQTLSYFKEKKNEINNIIIKEEVIEFEGEDFFSFLDKNVSDEQRFIYNDEDSLEIAKKIPKDDEEAESIQESFNRHHRITKPLPALLEESNNQMKLELNKYLTMNEDDEVPGDDNWEPETLFDKETIDLARQESIDHIYTINWLEKQLVEYRKEMNDSLSKGGTFQINNELRKLDVGDPDEIKNKIKDIQESIRLLKSRSTINENENGADAALKLKNERMKKRIEANRKLIDDLEREESEDDVLSSKINYNKKEPSNKDLEAIEVEEEKSNELAKQDSGKLEA